MGGIVLGMKKRCPLCEKVKPIEDFNAQGGCCRVCHNARNRAWRHGHREASREAQTRYVERHRSVLHGTLKGRKTLICQKCRQRKPVDAFHWRNKEKGIKSFVCRDCVSEAKKRQYGRHRVAYVKRNRARQTGLRLDNTRRILEYLKSHPCVDCGEGRPLRLSFDHVRGKKEFTIANHYLLAVTWDRLLAEIQKCDVRCMNCHTEKTAKEQGRLMWKILNGMA
jgi:hypothetical protein